MKVNVVNFKNIMEVKDFLNSKKRNINYINDIAALIIKKIYSLSRLGFVTALVVTGILRHHIPEYRMLMSIFLIISSVLILAENSTLKILDKMTVKHKLDYIEYCGERFNGFCNQASETEFQMFIDDCSSSIGLEFKKGRKLYE